MNRSYRSAPVIRILGARTHSLKNVSVSIPLGRLTVVTGVSGSGKSSGVWAGSRLGRACSAGASVVTAIGRFWFVRRPTLAPLDSAIALRVAQEGPEGIVVRGAGNTRFHYVVYAERAEIVGYEPVVKNVSFTPEVLEKLGGPETLPEPTRALLVKNGTLNADGSYNVETARAHGWTIPKPASRPDLQKP